MTGHFPNAKNIPFKSTLLTSDGSSLRPKNELKEGNQFRLIMPTLLFIKIVNKKTTNILVQDFKYIFHIY